MEPERLAKAVDKIVPQLREAFSAYLVEATPLRESDERTRAEFLAHELSKFIKLVGGGWHPDQRKDFMEAAYDELEEVPFDLLLRTVQEARRAVWDAKRFVPWCFERMEKRLNLLNEEGRVLRKLIEIADR